MTISYIRYNLNKDVIEVGLERWLRGRFGEMSTTGFLTREEAYEVWPIISTMMYDRRREFVLVGTNKLSFYTTQDLNNKYRDLHPTFVDFNQKTRYTSENKKITVTQPKNPKWEDILRIMIENDFDTDSSDLWVFAEELSKTNDPKLKSGINGLTFHVREELFDLALCQVKHFLFDCVVSKEYLGESIKSYIVRNNKFPSTQYGNRHVYLGVTGQPFIKSFVQGRSFNIKNLLSSFSVETYESDKETLITLDIKNSFVNKENGRFYIPFIALKNLQTYGAVAFSPNGVFNTVSDKVSHESMVSKLPLNKLALMIKEEYYTKNG